MISTTLFLTAGLIASPVIIQDVKASREAGHLRVEVAGDGGIDPDGARTKIDDGLLLIYLTGTRVRADNRSWALADGAGAIRAHRHRYETELVVPLAGNGCAGPVELQGTDSGITALVGCDGAVAGKGAGVAVRDKVRAKSPAAAGEERLKSLVALPPTEARPAAEAKAPARAEAMPVKVETAAPAVAAPEKDKPDVAAAIPPAPKPAAPIEPKVEAKAMAAAPAAVMMKDKAPAAAELLIPAASMATTATASGGGLRSIGLPAMLLGVLALGAYLFARRRRTVQVRHIQILETASLGPKRSLVVAKVGEETLILGTSEAGITLLKGAAPVAAGTAPVAVAGADGAIPTDSDLGEVITARVAAAAAQAEAEAAAFEIEQPLEEALADIPEPNGKGGGAVRASFRAIDGGLGGLGNLSGGFIGRRIQQALGEDDGSGGSDERIPFETRPPTRGVERADERLSLKDRLRGEDRGEARFDELLEDSLEDQELRRKLAAGMSARVR